MNENTMATDFKPHECVIFNPQKLVPTKIKPSTLIPQYTENPNLRCKRYAYLYIIYSFLQFDSCIQWLISRCPAPPPLCVQPIRDFATAFIDKAFFKPVLHDLEWRQTKGYLHQVLKRVSSENIFRVLQNAAGTL